MSFVDEGLVISGIDLGADAEFVQAVEAELRARGLDPKECTPREYTAAADAVARAARTAERHAGGMRGVEAGAPGGPPTSRRDAGGTRWR